ncbi:sugar transferase [Bacteroides thetaiotaomicron]|jgi:lipopolysaccharide/colanic/teichoic acid biosynthesis glycosyltransferase|uniref:Sugar transferase n=1 Tax=Bacteroides thetaiotaomicron TaxID=818 RepID=A0AAW4ZAV9_BACT4|nr:sugar transferase [Bacteroides thetaiotaomicron]MCE9241047.1 sugar transferase [Bacteroides thetaiotaomicron]MCE9270209.1 sugar transferase [Bacteroides thetaiotaomicron]MCE9279821.1 sugar transferase [Bacteroides thetaiotaomicron]MCE9294215.1 sugar transferase [Bacteroides thetaiotaomicron]MDC2233911.1 sugar transferase [Bacteroides thetaiotaomicron]
MFFKLLFDRIVAFCGLLLLWPLLLIFALLIKVQMPGPVLFVQKRVGKGGKVFNCHKFRSMKVDHDGSTVSVAGESRITPLGSKLRKYKIDELPGLWDVFIGNMSFVGPRPDVPGYADQLRDSDRDVLKLRPGITGPASLKYRDEEEMIAKFVEKVKRRDLLILKQYKDTDFTRMTDEQIAIWYNDNIIYPDKVRINCYYYHNYSFVKDIQMIFATVLGKRIQYAGEII